MLEKNYKRKDLVVEISRLKDLQKRLREDIARYKRVLYSGQIEHRRGLSEKEKEELVNNFHYRLKRNSWILKKIIFQIRQMYC